jgi:hypothetical protein
MSAMQQALAAWIPADDEMWQLCNKQDYQGAFKTFDEKVAPQASALQEAADKIVTAEHRSLDQEKLRALELPSQSRWIAIALTLLSLVIGGIVLASVRNITRQFQAMAGPGAPSRTRKKRCSAKSSVSSWPRSLAHSRLVALCAIQAIENPHFVSQNPATPGNSPAAAVSDQRHLLSGNGFRVCD